jgi:hypothetical protein
LTTEPIIVIFSLLILCASVAALAVYDLRQRKHAVLRNFPVVGHLRYVLESLGPELRQYIVTGNNDERRSAASSDDGCMRRPNGRTTIFGDVDFDPAYQIPCLKVVGAHAGRRKAFRPTSIVNISSMSVGSLSGAAVEALNRGAALAGCLQNTGEGGVSRHHSNGGDLIAQIGTGYFGCRETDRRHDAERVAQPRTDPTLKAARLANYIVTLRKELLALARAVGVEHPAEVSAHDIEILDDRFRARTLADLLGGRQRRTAVDVDRNVAGDAPGRIAAFPMMFRRHMP